MDCMNRMFLEACGNYLRYELGLGAIEKPNITTPTLVDIEKSLDDNNFCIKQVTGGQSHTLILLSYPHYPYKTRLLSCGSNDRQQLGRNGSCCKVLPVERLDSHCIKQISSGLNHNVVLTDAGQLFSWGCNQFNQLGYDSSDSVGEPSIIKSLALESVIAISCGANHSLALTKKGAIFSWGANNYGQCGISETNTSIVNKPTMITSGGVNYSPISSLSAGGYHSIALSYTGVIYVWGKNEFGQLGLGHTFHQKVPVALKFLRNQKIVYIDSGEDFSVALTEDGGIFTWGSDRYGQLGHGGKNNEITPRKVVDMMGSIVVQVACGRCHTLILLSDSKIFSMGLNACGQLGTADLRNQQLPTLVSTSFLGNSMQISRLFASKGDHSYFVTTKSKSLNSPEDYRVLNQVLPILDNNLFNIFKSLNADQSIPIDFIDYIENVIGSIPSWNGSYLKKDSVMPSIDWLSLNYGFQCLKDSQHDRINELIYQVIFDEVLKNLPKTLNDAMESEILRIYLLLPMLHIFQHNYESFETSFNLNVLFSEKFLEITSHDMGRNVLENWLSEESNLIALRTLLTIFKKLVVDILSEQKKLVFPEGCNVDPNDQLIYMFNLTQYRVTGDRWQFIRPRAPILFKIMPNLQYGLKFSLCTLCFLFQVSQKNGLICYKDFYIAELNDLVDIRLDYSVFSFAIRDILPQQHPINDVFFCKYPFLLDAEAKSLILDIDLTLQQLDAAGNSIDRPVLIAGPFALFTENPHLHLTVSRDRIIPDTIEQLLSLPYNSFKKPLKVEFRGEEAVDAGIGMKKEYFMLLLKEILDPKYGMFIEYKDTNTIWFNPLEFQEPMMYNLVGVICGLLIYNQATVYLPFPLVLYKKLLEEDITLDDLSSLDKSLTRNLKDMLNPQLSKEDFDSIYGDLNFVISLDCFGTIHNFDLCGNKEVTYENRKEYVSLYWKFLLIDGIDTHYRAFQKGFEMVVGNKLLKLFHAEELLMLVNGRDSQEWDELEKSTIYKEPFNKDHPTIKLFWSVFHELEESEKKQFLLFLTGSDRVPLQGMKALHLKIQPMKVSDDHLPVAHACFNLLDLPEEYKSPNKLKVKLLKAIEVTSGFTLA